MTRHVDRPKALLEGFQGIWLSDGASNYNAAASVPGVERTGCWSHGRRYLFEARKDHVAVLDPLALVRDVFISERTTMASTFHPGSPIARSTRCRFLRSSGRGQAAEERLRPVGELPPPAMASHSSTPERDPQQPVRAARARPGHRRRNWLFAGSPAGADASAVWCSLLASCMLIGEDPLAYLRDVLPGSRSGSPRRSLR